MKNLNLKSILFFSLISCSLFLFPEKTLGEEQIREVSQEGPRTVPEDTFVLMIMGNNTGIEQSAENTRRLALKTFDELGIPKNNIVTVKPSTIGMFALEGPGGFPTSEELEKLLLEMQKIEKENQSNFKKLIESKLSELERKMNPKSRLIVLPISHGKQIEVNDQEEGVVSLFDPYFSRPRNPTYRQFSRWFQDNLKDQKKFLILPQCHSGHATQDPTTRETFDLICTSSQEDEVALAGNFLPHLKTRENSYHKYLYFFLSALRKKYPDGTPIQADANADGLVSIPEAYRFARQKLNDLGPILHKNYSGYHSIPTIYTKKPGETSDHLLCRRWEAPLPAPRTSTHCQESNSPAVVSGRVEAPPRTPATSDPHVVEETSPQKAQSAR